MEDFHGEVSKCRHHVDIPFIDILPLTHSNLLVLALNPILQALPYDKSVIAGVL